MVYLFIRDILRLFVNLVNTLTTLSPYIGFLGYVYYYIFLGLYINRVESNLRLLNLNSIPKHNNQVQYNKGKYKNMIKKKVHRS